MSTVPRQGFKKKSLVFRKIALEARLPPHNGQYKFVIRNAGGANTVTFNVKVAK